MAQWSVAVAQTVPYAGDVQRNVEQHLELARAAAQRSVTVLVFPELSLTGYELESARENALVLNDERLSPLLELASVQHLTLVVGAPLWKDSKLHIAALVLSPDGAIGMYAKQHLGAFSAHANPGRSVPPAESSVFEAGTESPLFALQDKSVALAICADTTRAAHAEAAARRGACAYLAGMFVIPADLAEDHTRLAGYAARLGMLVAFANYGGPSGGLPSAGRSAIWSPSGALLAELDADGLGLVIARESAAGVRGEAVRLRRESAAG